MKDLDDFFAFESTSSDDGGSGGGSGCLGPGVIWVLVILMVVGCIIKLIGSQ